MLSDANRITAQLEFGQGSNHASRYRMVTGCLNLITSFAALEFHMSDPKWSLLHTLESVRNVPSPITDPDSARAFHDAVALLQNAPSRKAMNSIAKDASEQLIRVIRGTASTNHARKYADEILFGLKVLALTGTPQGADCTVEVIRTGLDSDHYMWSVVFEMYSEGHPHAIRLFAALSKSIPTGFIGVAFLDAANTAAREHGLKPHPFDSPQGVKRLRTLLASISEEESSYAVSACAAIPFLSAARRKPLIALARKHNDPSIRMEVAWAMGKLKDKQSIQYLIRQCLDRNMSQQAQHYLNELKLKRLIPKAAQEPDFAALAEMCNWLRHPNEYGEPPDTIELMDKRTIFWPPLNKKREMRLFSFVYNRRKHRPTRDIGVGMVGSTTWSFFDATKPNMKPEDLYGIHCCWELECEKDPRTPKKPKGGGWDAKAGWKLITAGPSPTRKSRAKIPKPPA